MDGFERRPHLCQSALPAPAAAATMTKVCAHVCLMCAYVCISNIRLLNLVMLILLVKLTSSKRFARPILLLRLMRYINLTRFIKLSRFIKRLRLLRLIAFILKLIRRIMLIRINKAYRGLSSL